MKPDRVTNPSNLKQIVDKRRHNEIDKRFFEISYEARSLEHFIALCKKYLNHEKLEYREINIRDDVFFKVWYKEYDGTKVDNNFGYFEKELNSRIKENIIEHRKDISDYFN